LRSAIEVRGRRYSVPAHLAGRAVPIRLTLDGELSVYDGEQPVANHRVSAGAGDWVTIPAHHAALWAKTLEVEQGPLTVYEEVTTLNTTSGHLHRWKRDISNR